VHGVWVAALAVVSINVPFGFLRARTRRFSPQWFLAVHAPVPLVIAVRLLSGIGWRWATVPLFAAAFCAGQLLGGRLRAWRRRAGGEPERQQPPAP
jgi:hypothetical protein